MIQIYQGDEFTIFIEGQGARVLVVRKCDNAEAFFQDEAASLLLDELLENDGCEWRRTFNEVLHDYDEVMTIPERKQ